MSKPSVLMVVAKYPATHGHTTVINNLCKGLNKLGYKAAIGAFSFDSDPPDNIEKVKLSKSKLLTSGVKYLDYDIIHTHQPRVNYYLLSKKPSKPIVLHYHGASKKIHELNFKSSMKLYKNRIAITIAVSNSVLNQIRKFVGDIPTQVIYNGVDTTLYIPSLPLPYKKGDPQLLFVSVLRPYKNTDLIIQMMPQLLEKFPNAHLQIVGGGEELHKLKKSVKNKNLNEKIEFTGNISDPEELKLRYSSCDLFISASTLEACPVPPFEAMACGKPLVLYDIEAHKEIIDSSKAGALFSSKNPSEICAKIEEVYKNKAILGEAGRKFSEKYDWLEVCEQVGNLYEKLLESQMSI